MAKAGAPFRQVWYSSNSRSLRYMCSRDRPSRRQRPSRFFGRRRERGQGAQEEAFAGFREGPSPILALARTSTQTTRQYARLVSTWVAMVGLGCESVWYAFLAPHEGDADHLDFASFSTRENIRIQSGTRPNKTTIMVNVQPDKFEQYCKNYDKDRNWQTLVHFADAKYDMSATDEQG